MDKLLLEGEIVKINVNGFLVDVKIKSIEGSIYTGFQIITEAINVNEPSKQP